MSANNDLFSLVLLMATSVAGVVEEPVLCFFFWRGVTLMLFPPVIVRLPSIPVFPPQESPLA